MTDLEDHLPSSHQSEPKWLGRCAGLCALLPVAAALLLAIARDRGPVWRAHYHAGIDWSGAPHLAFERTLERSWDRQHPVVPGALEVQSFSARYDTCLWLEQSLDLPFMLVSDGVAELRIDDRPVLGVRGDAERQTRGMSLPLQPGWHHLQVNFSARRWPSIGLYASFAGQAPVALPPDDTLEGLEFSQPTAAGCGAHTD